MMGPQVDAIRYPYRHPWALTLVDVTLPLLETALPWRETADCPKCMLRRGEADFDLTLPFACKGLSTHWSQHVH